MKVQPLGHPVELAEEPLSTKSLVSGDHRYIKTLIKAGFQMLLWLDSFKM